VDRWNRLPDEIKQAANPEAFRKRLKNSKQCCGSVTLLFSFAYYFLKLLLHHFSNIKSQKEVTKQ
jgi:hypothetical protein